MALIALNSDVALSEGRIGGNFLKYLDSDNYSNKLWLSANERIHNKFGISLFVQSERVWYGEGIYGEIKPYYELTNRVKLDIQFVHDGWRGSNDNRFTHRNRAGFGVEFKLWD